MSLFCLSRYNSYSKVLQCTVLCQLAVFTLTIMHFAYPPKLYITIVSNFSWVLLTVIPREIEDNSYAKFGGRGWWWWGRGLNKVHYGLWKNGELRVVELIPSFRVKKV